MSKSIEEQIIERYSNAKTIRNQTDDQRYEAGYYAWNAARDVWEGYSHEERLDTRQLFTSVPTNASHRAASGIFSYLMPVGDRWFEFSPQDYDLADDDALSRWLSKASSVLHDEICRNNFQVKLVWRYIL